MAAQIGRIAKERGLDVQDFQCLSCQQQQGVTTKLKYVYHKPLLYNIYIYTNISGFVVLPDSIFVMVVWQVKRWLFQHV